LSLYASNIDAADWWTYLYGSPEDSNRRRLLSNSEEAAIELRVVSIVATSNVAGAAVDDEAQVKATFRILLISNDQVQACEGAELKKTSNDWNNNQRSDWIEY
jgi:hypothetical protein